MEPILEQAASASPRACIGDLFVKNDAKITHFWCSRGTMRRIRRQVRRGLLLVQELTVRKGDLEENTVPEICDYFDKFAARML